VYLALATKYWKLVTRLQQGRTVPRSAIWIFPVNT